MVVTTALFAFAENPVLEACTSFVAGIANAILMLAWTLVLIIIWQRSPGAMIVASLCSLAVGGLLIMGLPNLPPMACLIVLMVVGVVASIPIFLAEPHLDDPPERFIAAEGTLRDLPWFTIIILVACGFAGTVMYGATTALFWQYGDPLQVPLFVIAVIGVLGFTVYIMLAARHWESLVWLPTFILALIGLLVSCFASPNSLAITLSLLLPSVFCSHFLRWLVFPGLIARSKASPFVATCLTLIITNSFISANLGTFVIELVPVEFRTLSAIACFSCIMLIGIFAIAFVMGNRNEHLQAERIEQSPSLQAEERFTRLGRDHGLTDRELEVALLTAKGYASSYIAERLVIAGSTVRFHQQNAYRKLDIHSKQELIALYEKPSAA